MLSGDSGNGESLCTPSSVSKRLFGAGGSSSKRSLFGQESRVSKDTAQLSGGEESDLGPMSPLALTDRSESSCDSSPGRSFVSPFTSPVKSPSNHLDVGTSWDRLRPNSSRDKSDNFISAFDALKTLTIAARFSSGRKIASMNLAQSLPTTPIRKYLDGGSEEEEEGHRMQTEWYPGVINSPEHEIASFFDETDIVPETPCRRDKDQSDDRYDDDDRIEETPRKRDKSVSERRLITPLSCVQKKEIIVPRLHRRKSLCPFDTNDEQSCSPERIQNVSSHKRHASDCPSSVEVKKPKIDDTPMSIPKARASLFRETANDLTLSAKSFYKSTGKRCRSVDSVGDRCDPVVPIPVESSLTAMRKKRHSLPSHTVNHYHKRGSKRVTKSGRNTSIGMNAGVRHGIKRPKIKRHVSRVEAFKTEKQKITLKGDLGDQNKNASSSGSSGEKIIVDNEPKLSSFTNTTNMVVVNPPRGSFDPIVNRAPSPIADPNKRFFKTNRTMKTHRHATVTVNDKIKLKVSDGKIALNENHSQMMRNPRKRARFDDMSFDTTDLTVDEPNFDTSMEKKNIVDGILKVLEDDWADDEYDTMETLTSSILSPIRSHTTPVSQPNCATMSPASVLSNMTLSMNIKDSTSSNETKSTDDANSTTRLYPLFTKGYSSSIVDENSAINSLKCGDKKSPRGLKRSWQTSAKAGGAENQYQIDAGQKRFGATTCNECGIVYQLGEPEDENAHLNYHNNVKTLRFNGWKNERVIATDHFTNSRIIGIEPGDPKLYWKKVEQVLAVVDKDLGLADMELSSYFDKKIYFYVRDRTILGVMVVERVQTAHRMIPEFAELNCCSAEDTPAKCGINVIWTAMSHRRKHIATKLLDTLRSTYYFGYIMSLDDIAFSMPTPSGKIFAEKYTKTRNFKVYN